MTAPAHVFVVQGPTDPANLYVLVTWDRNDPLATGYNVLRDGVVVGSTTDAGGAADWDKRYFKDTTVTPLVLHAYQVQPVYGATPGPISNAAYITVRRAHASKVFDVTSYAGATLRIKLAAARAAAVASAPSFLEPATILFPAGTHTFTASDTAGSILSGDANIIIRGAGMTSTILRAGWTGSSVESGLDNILLKWGGSTTAVAGVNPSTAVARGSLGVTLNDASAFAPGDIIGLNQITGTTNSADDGENYDAWDANTVESIAGNFVTVKYPWAKPFTTAATVMRLTINGCGIEQLTVEGQGSTEQTYYTLLQAEHCANHSFAEVRARWCNRNAIYTRGYKHSIVACTFTQTDPRADAGESFRYVITAGRGMRLATIGCVFGDLDRVSSSMMTTQVSHKQIVRHNQFLRSINYGWNSHGTGDYWSVVENNYFYMPEATKGGCFLGNSSFVYAGPTIIRGNLFDACKTACVAFQQNSYGTMIVDNWFRDTKDDLVNWYGSQFASMSAATYGSARIAVRRNKTTYTGATQAKRGYIFGYNAGSVPFPGVRDLIITDNLIDVQASAVALGGSSSESYDFQVARNTGTNDYLRPPLVSGDYWAGNPDATGFTSTGDDTTPFFTDTFSGTAGASAGWPIYLRSTGTGAGSDFTVSSSGNYGRLSVTSATAGARKIVCALRGETGTDFMQLVDLRNASLTISRIQAVVARHGGSSANANHYRAVYEYNASSNKLRLEKVISGVTTVLAQSTAFDAALTADLRIRFEVTGTTIRMKAWLTSGSEPGSWTLSTTDSSITDNGKAGVLADNPDATTASSDFDNYKLVNYSRAAQADYGSARVVAWAPEVFTWEPLDLAVDIPVASTTPVVAAAAMKLAGLAGSLSPLVFIIKRGDTDPPIVGQALQPDPAVPGALIPWPIPASSTVKFTMRDSADFQNRTRTAFSAVTPKVHATAAVDDATNGIMSYGWVLGDTDSDGQYRGEFEVTTPDGEIRTFPVGVTDSANWVAIAITDDLDPGITP